MTTWPDIPFRPWAETCAALHLYTQIAGKYRLAKTPWVNHSWHATFYATPRGLTSGLTPDGPGVEIVFDLIDHEVVATAGDGVSASFPIAQSSVAAFFDAFRSLVRDVGGDPTIHGTPNEIPDPVPFAKDHAERPYDADAVTRFHQALVAMDAVFKEFRTGFLGKVSPSHLFWGSFDLAVTRFSGRDAPLHPGGIPALPDDVTREAYSHEVSSAGFWPGGGPFDGPAFYSYAYPKPNEFEKAPIEPADAFWSEEAGEFILPYDVVRTSSNPEAVLMAFLQSTYDAAANLGGWDRAALDCPLGALGLPRRVGEVR